MPFVPSAESAGGANDRCDEYRAMISRAKRSDRRIGEKAKTAVDVAISPCIPVTLLERALHTRVESNAHKFVIVVYG